MRHKRDRRVHARTNRLQSQADATTGRPPKTIPYLRPDTKAQVSVRYVAGKTRHINALVVSHQTDKVDIHEICQDIEDVVRQVLGPTGLPGPTTRYIVNPTGSFTLGGPCARTRNHWDGTFVVGINTIDTPIPTIARAATAVSKLPAIPNSALPKTAIMRRTDAVGLGPRESESRPAGNCSMAWGQK